MRIACPINSARAALAVSLDSQLAADFYIYSDIPVNPGGSSSQREHNDC